MVSTASSQNSIPGLTTELNGWTINVYSLVQKMVESNYSCKGENEKTGLIMCINRNQFYTIDHLYSGSIIYGLIKTQLSLSLICIYLQAVKIYILTLTIFILIALGLFFSWFRGEKALAVFR